MCGVGGVGGVALGGVGHGTNRWSARRRVAPRGRATMVRRSPEPHPEPRTAHVRRRSFDVHLRVDAPLRRGSAPRPGDRFPRRGRGALADDRGAAATTSCAGSRGPSGTGWRARRAPTRASTRAWSRSSTRSSRPTAGASVMNLCAGLARVAADVADDLGPALREALAAECLLARGGRRVVPARGQDPRGRAAARGHRGHGSGGDHPRPRLVRDRRARHRVRPGMRPAPVRDRLRGRPRSGRPAPRPPARRQRCADALRLRRGARGPPRAASTGSGSAARRSARGLRGAHRDALRWLLERARHLDVLRRDPRDHGQARARPAAPARVAGGGSPPLGGRAEATSSSSP